jgi:hypothetical protein
MRRSRHPSLFQLNTRVYLTALSRVIGRPATLDDVPDTALERLATLGFDWVWLLSVWQTGFAARDVSRARPEWRREFEETLPDLTDSDIAGSGFAITGYTAHASVGGDEALARFRARLAARGLRLMLDFVPNHMGLGHPWAADRPDYFVSGTEADLAQAPGNFTRVGAGVGDRILAYGRDPYFPGWPDTLQLNYGNPATQDAMIAELLKISAQCDGVRCDMAMLVLPDVFERTWGIKAQPFWSPAITRVRERLPGFCFMAEAYWDLEWTLQQQGFDYAYDKRLYDRLREGHARPVREHFHAALEYQHKLARFLENHDEPRAAAAFFREHHQAAAVITFLSPGLRFFHDGQFEGKKKRISPHLVRGPAEPVDQGLRAFYDRLLNVVARPIVRDGDWQLLECRAAWEGNWTWDCFVAFLWQSSDGGRLLVVVNFADHQSQCYVQLPLTDLVGTNWHLVDHMGSRTYERDGDGLRSRGLYVDLAAWRSHVFTIERQQPS